jgi:hypothetical protein
VQLLWSLSFPQPLRGLAIAREPGLVFGWDSAHRLFCIDRAGDIRARNAAPGPVTAAACADDGSVFATVGPEGQVWLLGRDLLPRWERSVGHRAVAVALTSFGEQIAVADASAAVHVFSADGQRLWRATTARPLQFLAFVPEAPALVGSADLGLVCCFGPEGRTVWRDGLVANVGSLACTGNGATIALACFTEGLVCYGVGQSRQRRLPQAAPCRLAALSYDGETMLTLGLDNRLFWRDREAAVRGELVLEGAPVALALGALGAPALVALAEGKVLALAPKQG